MSGGWRDHLLPADEPRLVHGRGLDPWTYAEPIRATPRAQGLLALWDGLYREPFRGITTDGEVVPGLFPLADEGFDPAPAVAAARAVLDLLDAGQVRRVRYPVDAPQWRAWYNPEWPANDHGLRLDLVDGAVRTAVQQLVQACLGEQGAVKAARTRSANLFLGELYDLRGIMNDWSYHFLLFGEPGTGQPWGWNLYGHHLAVNCLVLGRQLVVSPVFLGAEPTVVEREHGESFELFRREALAGVELVRSLPQAQRERAVAYRRMHDPAMPPERWNFADERHLGGAFQDNRVIPYEGVPGRDLTEARRRMLLEVTAAFLEVLPPPVLEARMRQVADHLDDTWFSWIGPTDGVSPFYYRVHGPVLMVEFDNHCGMWLTNTEPARFHVHTVVRTPNGNDYGRDLLRQHYAAVGHDGGVDHVPAPGDGSPDDASHHHTADL